MFIIDYYCKDFTYSVTLCRNLRSTLYWSPWISCTSVPFTDPHDYHAIRILTICQQASVCPCLQTAIILWSNTFIQVLLIITNQSCKVFVHMAQWWWLKCKKLTNRQTDWWVTGAKWFQQLWAKYIQLHVYTKNIPGNPAKIGHYQFVTKFIGIS
jgi:hypothetical protein